MENLIRCPWSLRSEEEVIYHDTEWGRPSKDDAFLFEMLVLEMMQAGLTWTLILRRREAMRQAFDGFDVQKIALYDELKISELLQNPRIIRNKLKVNAMVNNARRFIEIQEEFGSFSEYLWSWVDNHTIHNFYQYQSDVPSQSELSVEMSKNLKKRGFKFVGPVGIYAYLQSVGVVNDHLDDCFCNKQIKEGSN